MNHRLSTYTLALGLLSTSVLAQTGEQAGKRKVRQERAPMAKAAQESDASKSRNFHRSEAILGLDLWTTAGDDKTDLGDLHDFVVDSSNGAITHVIVSSGGIGSVGDTLRAISWDDIQWRANEDDERVASVKLTEEKFNAIPSFEEKSIQKLVGRGAVEAAAKRLGDAKKGMDEETAEEATAAARAAAMKGARHHLASGIQGLDIYGPKADKAFASIGDLVINCDEGTIAYVTVEANDEEYLVPLEVLTIKPLMTAGKKADVKFAAYVPVDESGMVGAPAIDAEAKHTAQEPRFRQMVGMHYKTASVGKTPKAAKESRAPIKSGK